AIFDTMKMTIAAHGTTTAKSTTAATSRFQKPTTCTTGARGTAGRTPDRADRAGVDDESVADVPENTPESEPVAVRATFGRNSSTRNMLGCASSSFDSLTIRFVA